MQALIKDIISSLEELHDQKRVEFAKTSYPTSMRVIGVINPNIKIILKELKSQSKNWTAEQKIEFAKQLTETNIFECHHLALEFIGKDKKALKALTKKDVSDLAIHLDNWVTVDCYSAYILGYAWREGIVQTEHILKWYDSEDFWRKRCALVATIALNQKARGGKGDPERTLKICKLAVEDHHDMISKALSWTLRELSKSHPDPVIEFMDKYRNRLHKRVIREVTHKLEKGTKN